MPASTPDQEPLDLHRYVSWHLRVVQGIRGRGRTRRLGLEGAGHEAPRLGRYQALAVGLDPRRRRGRMGLSFELD